MTASNFATRFRRAAAEQNGMALVVTLMVMMLVSVLMVGFVTAIIADQRASGLGRDQTQAYAVAHAGLEQLTSDLNALFVRDVSPNKTQLSALTTTPPSVTGFGFCAPTDTDCQPDDNSGYSITFIPDAAGNPRPEDPINGSPITAGPYQGFTGIITPYTLTVTARSRGGAEVRMRRELQTVAVPVFQFGMFSETDLAFHAGDTFEFGGRVHTNGNLFLAQGNSSTLWLRDRVTAFREVIRTHLPNGLDAATSYGGTVNMIRAVNTYRALLRTEGSLVSNNPGVLNEPKWTSTSVGTYNSYIRNGRTGAKQLQLPLVADSDGDGAPDAQPIELIRRPNPAAPDQPLVFAQRFFALASLRILLSDNAADITGLPTVTAQAPIPLGAVVPVGYAGPPFAVSAGPLANGSLAAGIHLSNLNEPLLNGFIKIEMQRQNGAWEDVTLEILNLGIAGRNLSSNTTATTNWNAPGTPTCAAGTPAGQVVEPQPNAVIRLQRVRDVPVNFRPCGVSNVGALSPAGTDYWPNVLYDAREGQFRDGITDGNMRLGGLMHYIELDMNNLRRWLRGQIGASGANARNENGFVIYFSDRRNNRNDLGQETGEYGFEDVVNPPNMTAVNNALDTGEDVNGSGTLETYGRTARNLPAGAAAPFDGAALPTTLVTPLATAAPAAHQTAVLIARANRPVHFRRALKLVNGGINGGANNIMDAGFGGVTVASENPTYIQGNFNATAASVVAEPNVPTAVIADAVTVLSNSWNDIRSFTYPNDAPNRRVASTTGYRVAIISGKTPAFPKPTWAATSFGSDGGAHNFIRSLEDWGPVIQRYRGSFVSLFFARQANGSFKCCDWDVYNKGDRDWAFDTDFLLPLQLPPGTPMFRDVNTLTFRQLLRPTQ